MYIIIFIIKIAKIVKDVLDKKLLLLIYLQFYIIIFINKNTKIFDISRLIISISITSISIAFFFILEFL